MTRDEILQRYRHLRAINARHNSAILGCVARPTLLENARRLGVAFGNTLVVDSEAEMALVFDLAIYTARGGRSRALDRYAKMARPTPGSDEALILNAMRDARFSIWRIQRRHETAGLIVHDVLREAEAWLVDEGMEASFDAGKAFAGRLFAPEGFAMTSGAIVPVDDEVLGDAIDLDPLSWRQLRPARVADDPRFAAAIYRAALDCGIMECVEYRAPGDFTPDPGETAAPHVPPGLPAPA
jgi:hypothetical protein